MIQANELRIGNYVKYADIGVYVDEIIGTPHIVCAEDFGMEENGEIRYYDPIPLTEEILFKCGFKAEPLDVRNPDEGIYYGLQLSDQKFIDLAFISGDKNGYLEVCLFPYEDVFRFKYLHQIQNLYFALTGKELVVNL